MNGTTTKVLIFPGGTENGLEIWKSLKDCKGIEVFAVSSVVANHAPFVFEKSKVIPSVLEDNWVRELNSAIDEWGIDYLYPANSVVIDALIREQSNINCPVLLPTRQSVELTRSKKLTLQTLEKIIPTPIAYSSIDQIDRYPAFAKPDAGYGSQGIVKLIDERQAKKFFQAEDVERFILQEYLPGEEYTIDCFSNTDGDLLFCAGRERERIRMGTSMRATRVAEPLNREFREYARLILEAIPITGAWFFQMKRDVDGGLKLLEIDIRIAGTMCLNRVHGVNFPALTLFQHMGVSVDILENQVEIVLDRALVNRYQADIDFDTVYVDLDDTLIVGGKVNTDLIKFLYQCLNTKKKIVLLSKSLEKDKVGNLRERRILEMFDELVWLKEDQSKADFILDSNSIFIDDSFSQRKTVADQCGILTFDCSMIEVLISDRV